MDLFWSPVSGYLLAKTSNAPHLMHPMLTTSHFPPALQDVSFVLTDLTSSYLSHTDTKMTDYLNNMVHLFYNPDMDSDAVGDSLFKEPD